MRNKLLILLLCLAAPLQMAHAATVPTFQKTINGAAFTLVGADPAAGAATTIPTVLVPVTLSFESKKAGGKPFVMNAAPDVARVLRSPVFSNFAFPQGGNTQYADAMLRASFNAPAGWHTLLAKPTVTPITITVPVGYGYVMTSKSTGRSIAVVDIEFLQRAIFRRVPNQPGKLVLAVTHNTTYYADGDATECCLWGTHGNDSSTGNSFVLGSYLHDAPTPVADRDVQPLTHQLAQFIRDPLFDPLLHGRGVTVPGNTVPRWQRPQWQPGGDQGACAGARMATQYFLLEPTNTNLKNTFVASPGFAAKVGAETYHLQNAALLSWYTGAFDGAGATFSFPDASVLPQRATPCVDQPRGNNAYRPATVQAAPAAATPNGHKLVGYWTAYNGPGQHIPLREVSPQWDIILVAFATPDRNAPEGTMRFNTPAGMDTAQFKADIAYMKSQGKKVMISLGGGGQHFTLEDPKRVPNFVSSVTRIIDDYGFDGIDIDFESPSLSIAPGDTDFRHPKTPSIVNLISAIRQLHDHFGASFMISLVPEGTQIPSGYPSYGGQFGSYLPIAYGLRDILFFMDTQDYNTPPLLGLDGEIYEPGSVDYHAAVTELVLHGFDVGGDPRYHFPPMPADKIAVGFLTGDTTPAIVSQAMDYIITGKAPAGTKYKLRNPRGYSGMLGAMFWTINGDQQANYNFSNLVGPQLHAYPAAK